MKWSGHIVYLVIYAIFFHKVVKATNIFKNNGLPEILGAGDGDSKDDDELFCAVMNPITGAYIDLSQLSSTPNKLREGDKKRKRREDTVKTRWLIKGWNYERPDVYDNFTISICSSPISKKDDDLKLSNLTGAYYYDSTLNEYLSIGEFSTKPVLLGDSSVHNKKLTLKYEDGSKCPNGIDKKSTIINFVCDRDILSNAQMNLVGSLNNCSYFFEVKSIFACPTSNKKNEINVIGIFFGIFIVFILVELARKKMLRMINKTGNLVMGTDTSRRFISSDGSSLFQPRWETIESKPRWKSSIKFLISTINAIPTNVLNIVSNRRQSVTKLPRSSNIYSRNDMYSNIRLSSPDNSSEDSFVRDMEQQNNVLDSLEINSINTTDNEGLNSNIDLQRGLHI